VKKYIYTIALDLASPGNQHCANCFGTLSFPIGSGTVVLVKGWMTGKATVGVAFHCGGHVSTDQL